MNLELNSTSIIRHAAAGDPIALNKLMELSKEFLLSLVFREMSCGIEKQNAEDLVQETLAVVLKIIENENLRLEHKCNSYIKLLKSCLRKVSANYFRKKQVVASGGTDNQNNFINLADRIDESVETVLEQREWIEGLFKLSNLNENEQMVIRSFFLNGQTIQNIATTMGWSKNRVLQYKSRALKKLRGYIGED